MEPSNIVFSVEDIGPYRIQLLTNASIAAIANILSCYLIVRKSPTRMGAYRWFLLDIVVRHQIRDFMISERIDFRRKV
jgi:hypothetical protein